MVDIENGVQCVARYDWFQTDSAVVVTILKRGLSLEQCTVDVSEGSCTVDAGGETIFTAKLLHDVDEERVTLTCTPSKIEVRLSKLVGERWTSLSADRASKTDAAVKPKVDWSALEKEALELEKDEGGPDALFKMLYQGADEDSRRAMMKSYSESGGTVLSMNWDEVKQKKVEPAAKDD